MHRWTIATIRILASCAKKALTLLPTAASSAWRKGGIRLKVRAELRQAAAGSLLMFLGRSACLLLHRWIIAILRILASCTKKTLTVWSGSFWRRGRDSNPRDAFNAYTISSRAPSASSATSPCAIPYEISLYIILVFAALVKRFLVEIWIFPSILFSEPCALLPRHHIAIAYRIFVKNLAAIFTHIKNRYIAAHHPLTLPIAQCPHTVLEVHNIRHTTI